MADNKRSMILFTKQTGDEDGRAAGFVSPRSTAYVYRPFTVNHRAIKRRPQYYLPGNGQGKMLASRRSREKGSPRQSNRPPRLFDFVMNEAVFRFSRAHMCSKGW